LNKQSDKLKANTSQGVRPGVFIAVLSAAALLLLGGVLLFSRKASAPASATSSGTVASVPVARQAPQTAPVGTVNPGNLPASTPVVTPANTNVQVSVQDLVAALTDLSQPLSVRKKAIKSLAQLGTPEALAALKAALLSGSEDFRAAIAEGMGECATPECAAMLSGLLDDSSETVVKAAVRGLAQQGSPQAVTALTQLLYDSQRSQNVRAAAAQGLATIDQPGAMTTLAQAAVNITDEAVVSRVLDAIATRNITETQPFFQNYLQSTASTELKVDAVEALAQAKGDPGAYLASLVSNPDPEIRAAAAWAMSDTDAEGNFGTQLLSQLRVESASDVRVRLYQALGNQESFDVFAAMAAVKNEADPTARVAGLDLLARTLRNQPDPTVQSYFDQTAAPELEKVALNGETTADRMAAVTALIRAGTPAALGALQQLTQQTKDPRVLNSASSFLASQSTAASPPNR
jgi:HEAT repeat protein